MIRPSLLAKLFTVDRDRKHPPALDIYLPAL